MLLHCGYSTIAWAASVDKGVVEDVDYGYKSASTAGAFFNFFKAIGTVAFSYAGCGAENPSNNRIHTREATKRPHVERCQSCLYSCGSLSLSRCSHRLPNLWPYAGWWKHPRQMRKTCMNYGYGQHVCCCPSHWKLPGI